MTKLTAKQQRFVDEYLVDCNATQAAIRAGYSEKSAEAIGNENLRKPLIAQALSERMNSKQKETIASQDEVLKFFTSIMRGEPQKYSSENIKSKNGVETTTITTGSSTPPIEERLDAAKELAKRHRLYDNISLEEEKMRKAKADADIAEAKAQAINENGDKVALKVDKLFDKLIDEVD